MDNNFVYVVRFAGIVRKFIMRDMPMHKYLDVCMQPLGVRDAIVITVEKVEAKEYADIYKECKNAH